MPNFNLQRARTHTHMFYKHNSFALPAHQSIKATCIKTISVHIPEQNRTVAMASSLESRLAQVKREIVFLTISIVFKNSFWYTISPSVWGDDNCFKHSNWTLPSAVCIFLQLICMPQMDRSILAINKNQHADEEVMHQTQDAQGTWPYCGHFQLHIFDCWIGLGIVILGSTSYWSSKWRSSLL